jgi:hypothetical protein
MINAIEEEFLDIGFNLSNCHDPQRIAGKVGKRDRASGAVMARCFEG